MIYDRPYMRSEPRRGELSVVAWTIIAVVAAFVVEHIALLRYPRFVIEFFALTQMGLQSGFVWTLLTHGFLHGNGFLHLLLNVLGIYLMGRAVLPLVGPGRFILVFLGSIVTGGIVWYAVHAGLQLGGLVVGASGGVFGLFSVFACMHPNAAMTLIPFPLTFKPKHLLWASLGIGAFGLLIFEIPGNGGTAHSAHLGGMLAGWIYTRFLHSRTGEFGSLRPSIELPAWMRKRRRAVVAKPGFTVNVSPPKDLRAEVDRILDKINSQGFGSLTEEERRVLDEARDLLNKR